MLKQRKNKQSKSLLHVSLTKTFADQRVCEQSKVSLCLTHINPLHVFAEGRQKRNVPNWAMTSSDFFGWVEELRRHAGYDQIQDLARTFWAHFPSADRLGYGGHEADE
uniref:Uncharacterized protein n=1 Tax=Mastacembelus armatus TaxID=205130 RepID=A0A3Q3RFA5_9TELE